MALKIAGIGTVVPEFSISQRDAAEASKSFCRVSDKKLRLIPALYRRSGVKKRHSVLLQAPEGDPFDRQSFYARATDEHDRGPTTLERMRVYEREAPRLAVRAARRAIADSNVDPASFTHAVTVSCTGFHAPGIDATLVEELGLPRTVQRTHVGFMGCHGALNGMRVASSFLCAQPEARVLVCAVELCTLHFFYGWDAEKIVANSLFADGAAAVVGVGESTMNGPPGWIAEGSGTLLMPDSEDAMTWKIGDHGFHMSLSARVPDLIRRNVRDWLAAWLAEYGLTIDDIGTWAVHPGGPRILTAFSEAIGLDNGALEVSRQVLAEFGNMSSPTLLFILERLRRSGARLPCVAVGFGPGMVIETLLVR
ncbi:MAG: type III polyketide synthase [Acidobacteria bacterium]|nr:type III polyketide synthase [Acidobacteriota bacterium]